VCWSCRLTNEWAYLLHTFDVVGNDDDRTHLRADHWNVCRRFAVCLDTSAGSRLDGPALTLTITGMTPPTTSTWSVCCGAVSMSTVHTTVMTGLVVLTATATDDPRRPRVATLTRLPPLTMAPTPTTTTLPLRRGLRHVAPTTNNEHDHDDFHGNHVARRPPFTTTTFTTTINLQQLRATNTIHCDLDPQRPRRTTATTTITQRTHRPPQTAQYHRIRGLRRPGDHDDDVQHHARQILGAGYAVVLTTQPCG
jgi:hypothetical protein